MKSTVLFFILVLLAGIGGCSKSVAVQRDSETAADEKNDTGDSDSANPPADTNENAGSDSGESDTGSELDSDTFDPSMADTDTSVLLQLGFEWVEIEGGTYEMGSGIMSAEDAGVVVEIFTPEGPVHTVTVPSFDLMKTEVTVAQYNKCVEAGGCREYVLDSMDYSSSSNCIVDPLTNNFTNANRDNHPANCIFYGWMQDFCRWLGGRLPGEAEWEYAARSRGKDKTYPWGEDPLSCELAITRDCQEDITMPVCSRPKGTTEQGLCDMSGNVMEFTEDDSHKTYDGAPDDGSAWIGGEIFWENSKIIRGCGVTASSPSYRTRTTARMSFGIQKKDIDPGAGFRCAK